MPIFNIAKNNELTLIKENDFKLEKEIHELTAKNLKFIFGLEYVSSNLQLIILELTHSPLIGKQNHL